MVKNLPANAGEVNLISGSGRSPGEENSKPFQYSCLGNPKDRRAWLATVHGGHKESDTTELLNTHSTVHKCAYVPCEPDSRKKLVLSHRLQ